MSPPSAAKGPARERPPAELGYAEAAAELDAIIAELDEGTIDVDGLAERFGRAVAIVEELDGRIVAAREKVEELAPRLDAIGRAAASPGNGDAEEQA